MTTHFYAPPDCFHGSRLVLPDDEARHAVRVLRKQAGDELVVVDGTGGWHRVRLDQVGDDRAAGTVLETRQGVGEPPYHLTVGLGLLKNRNRFETFVEKAVELGVRTIIPLHTQRTEKKGLKAARTEKLIVAAMKQCGRSQRPTLRAPTALPDVFDEDAYDVRLIAHEQATEASSIVARLSDEAPRVHVALLVGSEGGFSDEEIEQARVAGWEAVYLGPRRLRAETAAIAGTVAIQQALEPASSRHSL